VIGSANLDLLEIFARGIKRRHSQLHRSHRVIQIRDALSTYAGGSDKFKRYQQDRCSYHPLGHGE
jgi:hypothetical protein